MISDAHTAVKVAVAQKFTGEAWQRCWVHFMRNVSLAVSAKRVPPVLVAIKTIFDCTEPEAVAE